MTEAEAKVRRAVRAVASSVLDRHDREARELHQRQRDELTRALVLGHGSEGVIRMHARHDMEIAQLAERQRSEFVDLLVRSLQEESGMERNGN